MPSPRQAPAGTGRNGTNRHDRTSRDEARICTKVPAPPPATTLTRSPERPPPPRQRRSARRSSVRQRPRRAAPGEALSAALSATQAPPDTGSWRQLGPHQRHERIVELTDPAVTIETQPDRDVHHLADRLAVRRSHRRDGPQPPPVQPQLQHLSNFEHRDLPERHAHRLPGRDTNGGELTGSDTDDGGPRGGPVRL